MSNDRRYKQRGYQEREERPSRPSPSSSPFGRRMPVITNFEEVIRCSQCGADISLHFDVKSDSVCKKCQAPLHTCRNCFHFDTSARFECSEQIPKRIRKKDAANECEFYNIRTIAVKEHTISKTKGPDEAMRALENLFKK